MMSLTGCTAPLHCILHKYVPFKGLKGGFTFIIATPSCCHEKVATTKFNQITPIQIFPGTPSRWHTIFDFSKRGTYDQGYLGFAKMYLELLELLLELLPQLLLELLLLLLVFSPPRTW